MLKEELEKIGLGFHDWEDGTFTVHYNTSIDDFSSIGGQGNCTVREDSENYYINTGADIDAMYPKNEWSLKSAIEDYCVF